MEQVPVSVGPKSFSKRVGARTGPQCILSASDSPDSNLVLPYGWLH